MKNVLKATAAVIVLSATFAAPAFAMVSQSNLNQNINSALGSGSNVMVTVNDGVATITGVYEDAMDKSIAIHAAENTEGVNKVINLAFPRS